MIFSTNPFRDVCNVYINPNAIPGNSHIKILFQLNNEKLCI